MEWLKVAEQIGLGGLAIVGLIMIVRDMLNRTKNNDSGVLLKIILEKQNHISDNLKDVSEKLEKVVDKEDKIITRLEILSAKVNGYARNRN